MACTMASSEGSREIEAAQKRLAAAKARAAADAEALESAKEAEKSAKEMAQLAKKSAVMAEANATSAAKSTAEAESRLKNSAEDSNEAAKFLQEAEERWNIYTVDDAEGESRKKQKTGVVETIVVEGCGSPEANGTYKRSDRLFHDVHQYCKKGKWKGEDAKYEIYYNSHEWCIYVDKLRRGSYEYLYSAPQTTDAFAKMPPENGWKVYYHGVNPAPKLKWS